MQFNLEKFGTGSSDADRLRKRIYRYLQESANSKARKDWLERRKKGWEFYEGRQWTDAEKDLLKSKDMPDLVINMLMTVIFNRVALVTDSRPKITHSPIGGGDAGVAEVFTRGTDKVWEAEDGGEVLFDAALEAEIGGLGWQSVHYDKTAGIFGRTKMQEVDPLNVHHDPTVKKADVYGGRFVIWAERIRRKEAQDEYDIKDDDLINPEELTEADDEQEEQGGRSTSNPNDDYGSTGSLKTADGTQDEEPTVWKIEAWLPEVVSRSFVVNTQTGERRPLESGLDVEKANERMAATGMPLQVIKTKVRQVRRVLMVGKKIIDEKVNPYGTDYNGEPFWGLQCIRCKRVRGAYPLGDAHFLIDVQRELNKRRIQAVHAASTASHAPIVAPEGSMSPENKKNLKSNTKVAEYGKSGGPTRLSPGTSGMELVVGMEREAKQDMYNVIGSSEVLEGRSNSKQDSGKKVLALQEMATLPARPFLRELERVIRRDGQIITHLNVEYAPQKFWLELVDPKEDEGLLPALQVVLSRDVAASQFDVKVGAGSSMPANRIAKLDILSELLERSPDWAVDIVYEHMVRHFDEPGLEDEIKERKQELEQQAQMEAQAQAAAAQVAGAGGMPPQGAMM